MYDVTGRSANFREGCLGRWGLVLPILTGIAILSAHHPVFAQQQNPAAKSATLEARIVTDSNHCPTAVDIWLGGTPDTIGGLEITLHWDRPDFAAFVMAKAAPPLQKSGTAKAESDKNTRAPDQKVPVDTVGTLLSGWEYVEARSDDRSRVKLTALLSILSKNNVVKPLAPGTTGRLCRLPVERVHSPIPPKSSDSAGIWFDPKQSRLSDNHGELAIEVQFRQGVIAIKSCRHNQETPVK